MSNRQKMKRAVPLNDHTTWSGAPTMARRGTAIVAEVPNEWDAENAVWVTPDYWARKEGIIGDRIDVVELAPDPMLPTSLAYIDNRDGAGWELLIRNRKARILGKNGTYRPTNIVPGSFRPSDHVVRAYGHHTKAGA